MLILLACLTSLAHEGQTDRYGCHYENGKKHCHENR